MTGETRDADPRSGGDARYSTAGGAPDNDSPLGRLLAEISWEGNARRYRDGGRGRGRENVLTTEVLTLLDLLPRRAFLGAVLATAHGATAARTVAAVRRAAAGIDRSVSWHA